jgi:hypothetical protein
MRAVLAAAFLSLVLAPTALAGGPSLLLGATEDAPKSATATVSKAQMDLLVAAGFRAVRITQEWAPGVTALPATGRNVLENVATAAQLDGVTVICVVMSHGSATTPLTPGDQADFASYAASIATAIPTFRIFVVGNEPNLNRYWLPQFDEDGSDAAAPAYTSLLTQTYDALKAVSPSVTVLGGDVAGGIRPTHSPTTFIHDMGQALRDAGQTTLPMDGFDLHPYEDNSGISPVAGTHPNSTTIALADYDKLVASLGEAFGRYDLPIWYDEFGVESQIPAQQEQRYTGTEPATIHPVTEATQAAYYRQAVQLAFCQPNVRAMMLFHSVDEADHAAWQSGLYYAGTSTPKASLAGTKLALDESRRGVVAHCEGMQLPVSPKLKQARDRLTVSCALDCSYTVQLYRGTKLLKGARARATGGVPKLLVLRVPTTPGRYRARVGGVNPVNPAPAVLRWVNLHRG